MFRVIEAVLDAGGEPPSDWVEYARKGRWSGDLYRDAANLREANLVKADLTGANLSGANVTSEQLGKAASLEGMTMPDGTKHE